MRCYQLYRETGILLPNNQQRQHRTSHAPKDVLSLRTCANYCDQHRNVPIPSDQEKNKTVKAGFRPWFDPVFSCKAFTFFPPRSKTV